MQLGSWGMPHQEGLGLSELLIALLLSSFIMTGLMHHYLATKKQYSDIQKKLERSIDLQLVTDLIRDSIRKAGFTPCLSIDHLVTLDQRSEPKHLVALEVGADVTTPWLRTRRMSEHFDIVQQITNPMQLFTSHLQPLHRDQSIIIADCYHAEVQKISHVNGVSDGQIVMLSQPLAFTYHEPIYVGEWLEEVYSIRTGQNGESALFYQHYKHAEELTRTVHTLSARLIKEQGGVLVEIILGVDNAQTLKLETMIRAC